MIRGASMDKKKVSVVVPVYNAEAYLAECMESICAQTWENIEIICVDDGSSDGSGEILESFGRKDKRIRLLKQAHQYAGTARNQGFDASLGEYVIFLDGDDFFESSLVEKMVSAVQESHADIAVCKSRGLDERTGKEHSLAGALNMALLPEKKVFSKWDIPEHIFQLTAGWAWDKIYRSEFLREKHIRFPGFRAAEDQLFADLAFGEARGITVVDEVLVNHRTHVPASLEDKKDQYWHCGYEMLFAERSELRKRGLFPLLEQSFVNRAAGYLTWNACSITDPEFFSEFYTYFQQKAAGEFRFSGYPPKYYHDPFTYKIVTGMERLSEKEFLCGRIRELNETVADRDAYVEEVLSYAEQLKKEKHWRLPYDRIPPGSRLVVYGYGDVGRDWCEDIRRAGSLELVMAADKNYQAFGKAQVRVCSLKEAGKAEYDYILIAVYDRETADGVKDILLREGFLPEKILWFPPAERIKE